MADYGYQNQPGKKVQEQANMANIARARVDGVNASYRDLCNVCSNIRGRRADKAIVFLTEASDKSRPIRYFRHNSKRGHLRELGGKKGGFPVKSVKIVLDVLKNAYANAQTKGLGDCKIVHAVANKQDIYSRLSPKGRRVKHDFETAFVEVVLRELDTDENRAKKQEIAKAREKAIADAIKKAVEKKAADEQKKNADAAKKSTADSKSNTPELKSANVAPEIGATSEKQISAHSDSKSNEEHARPKMSDVLKSKQSAKKKENGK
ncbi:MAG: 50S ribosomal protein L22 [Candidatus Micrarchaeia archaeon]